MTTIRTLALAGLMLLLLTAAPAGAVIGGAPDGDDHPYVGMMVDGSFLCSGSLIREDVFVTAAHCAEDGATVRVTVETAPVPGSTVFVLGTFHRHPDACVACAPSVPGFASNDVAVVELDEPIEVARYAALPEIGLADTLAPRSSLTVVGYGVQGFVPSPGGRWPVTSFVRTQGTVRLSPGNFALRDEFLRISAGPASVCSGDSGGPNLQGDTIVAINSFVTNGNCAGGAYANRLDTSAALGFVAGFLSG